MDRSERPRGARWLSNAALAMSFVAGCATARPRPDPVGRDLDFEAVRLDAAGRLQLSSLRGKVVLVDVWTSWCVPCREALPVWGALRERLGDPRFEVVGVSIDDERAMAEDFVAELRAPFPMVWDDGALAKRFAIEELPTLFLVDGRGVVRWSHAGYDGDTEAQVEVEVRRLLASEIDDGLPNQPSGGVSGTTR